MTTSLDEIPGLLERYRSLDARRAELDALIDRAGQEAEPALAAERDENRAAVTLIRAQIEESDWPPTAPCGE